MEFKSNDGKQFEDQIISNRQDLKENKLKVKHFTEICNQSKLELDKIKAKLDSKADEKRLTQNDEMMGFDDEDNGAQANTGRQEIIDEEELALIQKMKEQKKVYRQNFDNLKQTKSQLFYISQTIDTLKQQLVSTFEEWYSQTFDEDELMQSTLVRFFNPYLFYSKKHPRPS